MSLGGELMESTSHYEQEMTSEQENTPTIMVKKHSIPGIISSIIVLVTLLGSIFSLMLLSSAVRDYKELAQETFYTYENLIEELNLDFATIEQQQKNDRAEVKLGVSFLMAILLAFGYFVAFILGIVGLVIANKKKVFSILGLIFSIVLPIIFFIVGLIMFFAPIALYY